MNQYLELKEGEKVVRRIPTTLASENRDRKHLETFYQKPGQKIQFVMSSVKEKVIQ